MSPDDVIEAYVLDVVRRLPAADRNEIGLELRDLLGVMLADKARTESAPADEPMALALLEQFGSPSEIAARYRTPGPLIIPDDQTRSFARVSIVGVLLQWALTLPRVFDGQPLAEWWFSWGLGSLWWPGLLVTIAIVATYLRQIRTFKPSWRPREVLPERAGRGVSAFALLWFALGAIFLTALPWIAPRLPGALPQVFALDPGFLRERAPLVLILWVGAIANQLVVMSLGRWSTLTRRVAVAFNVAFLALLAWWLAAGPIFRAAPTDEGAKAGISLVMLFIVVDLVVKLNRHRARLRPLRTGP